MPRLSVGTRVRTKVECVGDVDDVETRDPPGTLGVIDSIHLYEQQGVAVTVVLDSGVVNVFDQADGLLSEFLEVVAPPVSRFTVLLRGQATAEIEVEARDFEHAGEIALNMIEHGHSTVSVGSWEVEHVE